MWPGFDSRTLRHMWVEFVVGSRPCSERFCEYSGFPLSPKTKISKFQFDLNYCQVLYHEPLAREIAQALSVLLTLNKLLYFATFFNKRGTEKFALNKSWMVFLTKTVLTVIGYRTLIPIRMSLYKPENRKTQEKEN